MRVNVTQYFIRLIAAPLSITMYADHLPETEKNLNCIFLLNCIFPEGLNKGQRILRGLKIFRRRATYLNCFADLTTTNIYQKTKVTWAKQSVS